MANTMDRFTKLISGSIKEDVDFKQNITSSGDLRRLTGINTIINSWNNILNIPRGTYDCDPDFGSDLHKLVFEPADQKTLSKIKTEIQRSILHYDSRARIISIDVKFLIGGKGFSVNVTLSYKNEKSTLQTIILKDNVISVMG
jgi:phage baseplate assembly protein W